MKKGENEERKREEGEGREGGRRKGEGNRGGRGGRGGGRGFHKEGNPTSPTERFLFDPYSPGPSIQKNVRSTAQKQVKRESKGKPEIQASVPLMEGKPFRPAKPSTIHCTDKQQVKGQRRSQFHTQNPRHTTIDSKDGTFFQEGQRKQKKINPQIGKRNENSSPNKTDRKHFTPKQQQKNRCKENNKGGDSKPKQNLKRQRNKNTKTSAPNFKPTNQDPILPSQKFEVGKVLLQKFFQNFDEVANEDGDCSDEDDNMSFDSDSVTLGSLSDNSVSEEDEEDDDSQSFASMSEHNLSQDFSWNSQSIPKTAENQLQNRKVKGRSFPKIGVYWDIENCRIPAGKSARAFVKRVRNAFYEGYQEEEFVVVCDVSKEQKEMMVELSNAQVDVQHVMAQSKNAADEKLRQRMREFTGNVSPQSRVVLITSDINFCSDLRDMRYKKNMNVILIHSKMVNPAMTDFANENIVFEDFVKDLPSKQMEVKKPSNLLIKNLSSQLPEPQLRNILNRTFDNCGGKFVRIVKCEDVQLQAVLMQFRSPENAIRAKNRFNGHNILGSEIDIDFYSCEEPEKEEIKKSSLKCNKEVSNPEKPQKENTKESKEENTKESKEETSKICWIVINGDTTVSEVILKQSLSKTKLAYSFFEFINEKLGKWRCCIQYPSQNQAKKVLKALRQDFGDRINAEVFKNITGNTAQTIQPKEGSETNRLKREFIAIRDDRIKEHKLTKREMINQAKSMTEDEARVMQNRISMMDNSLSEFEKKSNQLITKFSDPAVNTSSLKMALIAESHRLSLGLPIYSARTKILEAYRKGRVLLVTGPPGIGKSTQIAQYILEESVAVNGTIAVVEPYRICAISHAHSAAKQYGSPVGTVVGYKILMKPIKKLTCKILYMTDEILLNEYRKDKELKQYTCIIVDEIQERSECTEILLSLLRNISKSREDLKIILLTANENTSSLIQFFSSCQKVSIPTKAFPVEVIWQPKGKKSTYTEVVFRIVQQILNECETGDILAFLPHPSDVLCAEILLKQRYENSELLIKSFYSEALFDEVNSCMTESNKRRVVLATSICQNALSFTKIKFVIDCGITKEIKGHRISNIFISKAEAQWRLMIAGGKEGGKCYRLYSQDDFETKAQVTKQWNPELVNLELQLLRLGLSSASEFPLVDTVDKEALTLARCDLENIGALQSGTLTEKGQQIAALNICPQLSMLITHTLTDHNLCCFTIFMAAIMSLNSIYPTKLKNKQNKIPETTSNILELTSSFNEWFLLNDKQKNKWCLENGIDGIVMAKIRDAVYRLHAVIKSEICKDIPLRSANTNWHSAILQKLLKLWLQNLCILKNPSANIYQCLKTGKKVFPMTTCKISPQPKYVVFDKVVEDESCTSFMINLIPMDETLVNVLASYEGAGAAKSIPKVENFFTTTICPIGVNLLKNSFKKIKSSLIPEMTLTGDENISVEICNKSGKMLIQAPQQRQLSLMQEKIEVILQEERDILSFAKFNYQFDKNTGIRACIAAAGHCVKLLLPEDYCDILVDVTDIENIDSIALEFEKFGHIRHRSVKKSKKLGLVQLKLQFEDSDCAKAAVNAKSPYKVTPICSAKNHQLQTLNPEFKIDVLWTRRRNTGTAIVNFDSNVEMVHLFSLSLLEMVTKPWYFENISVINEPSVNRIILKNVNPAVSKEEITSVIKSICLMSGLTLKNVEMPQVPGFTTPKKDLKALRTKVTEVISQYVKPSFVKVDIVTPKQKDEMWKAALSFQDPKIGCQVLEQLKQGAEIDGIPLRIKTLCLNATIYCRKSIEKAIEKPICDTLTKIMSGIAMSENGLRVSINPAPEDQLVGIKIEATNLNDYINICFHITKLIQGEKICFDEQKIKFFQLSLMGKQMLEELSAAEEVLIEIDELSRHLHFWGDSDNVRRCKETLKKFINEEIIQFSETSPYYFGDAPGLIASLVEIFGVSFVKFCNQTGCLYLDVNFKNYWLNIHGSIESIGLAAQKLTELKEKFLSEQSRSEILSSAEVCPICLARDIANRKHYRLEYCGHAYCLPCVALILVNSKVPLHCYHQNCGKPFVSLDFMALANELQPFLGNLLDKEVRQFIHSNCKQVILCPVPLCRGTLPVSLPSNNKAIVCSICNNAICRSCKTMYHYGQTCQTFKKFKGE